MDLSDHIHHNQGPNLTPYNVQCELNQVKTCSQDLIRVTSNNRETFIHCSLDGAEPKLRQQNFICNFLIIKQRFLLLISHCSTSDSSLMFSENQEINEFKMKSYCSECLSSTTVEMLKKTKQRKTKTKNHLFTVTVNAVNRDLSCWKTNTNCLESFYVFPASSNFLLTAFKL